MADDPIDVREMIAAYRAVAQPSPAVKRRIARALADERKPRAATLHVAAFAFAAAILLALAWRLVAERASREAAPIERDAAPYDAKPDAPRDVVEPRSSDVHAVLEVPPPPSSVMPARAAEAKPTSVPVSRSARVRTDAKPLASDRDDDATPRSGSASDDFAAELDLLARARSHGAAGRHRDALIVLDAHAQAFPHGVLGEEREALRVVAECSLAADPATARAKRVAFERRHPRSSYGERVRRACAAMEEAPTTEIP
jgi:hypothetical protein